MAVIEKIAVANHLQKHEAKQFLSEQWESQKLQNERPPTSIVFELEHQDRPEWKILRVRGVSSIWLCSMPGWQDQLTNDSAHNSAISISFRIHSGRQSSSSQFSSEICCLNFPEVPFSSMGRPKMKCWMSQRTQSDNAPDKGSCRLITHAHLSLKTLISGREWILDTILGEEKIPT